MLWKVMTSVINGFKRRLVLLLSIGLNYKLISSSEQRDKKPEAKWICSGDMQCNMFRNYVLFVFTIHTYIKGHR